MATKKKGEALPVKKIGKVEKIKAPDLEQINDKEFVEFRMKRATERRPAHIQ